MPSKQVTMSELKTLDPKRYEEEYNEFLYDALDTYWYGYVKEMFISDMATYGLVVADIDFECIDGWHGSATFRGLMPLVKFMNMPDKDGVPLAEQYPLLYAAAGDAQTVIKYYAMPWRRAGSISEVEIPTGAEPCGLFAGLDEDEWLAQIEAQWAAADIEGRIADWGTEQASRLRKMLNDEYNYLTSEEQFLEMCDANDYTVEIECDDDEVCY